MSAAPARPPVRVLLVDDSPLIRLGLRAALEDWHDIAIVGEAGTAAEGVAAVEQHKPDVVLLDLRLPDRPGLAVCREIVKRRPATRVLILTSSTDERNVHEAVAAGARASQFLDIPEKTWWAGAERLEPRCPHRGRTNTRRGRRVPGVQKLRGCLKRVFCLSF